MQILCEECKTTPLHTRLHMRPSIVWASCAMLAYELYTLNSRGETWTDSVVKRDKRSVLIWSYWGWLGLHLITGGRI